MHLLYALLHECPDQPLSGWDPDVMVEDLEDRLHEYFDQRLSFAAPVLSVMPSHQVRSFPAHAQYPIVAEYLQETLTAPWEGALRLATSLVARTVHLYETSESKHTPGEKRLRTTFSADIVMDICSRIPAALAQQYARQVDQLPLGASDVQKSHWTRIHTAKMYECFRASYVPPFTRAFFTDIKAYPCLDLRACPFKQKCDQGQLNSLNGDVAISFVEVHI